MEFTLLFLRPLLAFPVTCYSQPAPRPAEAPAATEVSRSVPAPSISAIFSLTSMLPPSVPSVLRNAPLPKPKHSAIPLCPLPLRALFPLQPSTFDSYPPSLLSRATDHASGHDQIAPTPISSMRYGHLPSPQGVPSLATTNLPPATAAHTQQQLLTTMLPMLYITFFCTSPGCPPNQSHQTQTRHTRRARVAATPIISYICAQLDTPDTQERPQLPPYQSATHSFRHRPGWGVTSFQGFRPVIARPPTLGARCDSTPSVGAHHSSGWRPSPRKSLLRCTRVSIPTP